MDARELLTRLERGERVPLIGFAGLMRVVAGGVGFDRLGPLLEARVHRDPRDAEALMDLGTLLCVAPSPGNRDIGLAMQSRALSLRRVFHLPASAGAASLRVLAIFVPGDASANTPVDCLIEDSDVALDLLYAADGQPLPPDLPEHDAALVAVGESSASAPLLAWLDERLRDWPRPVLNRPAAIARLSRESVAARLADAPGVAMPATHRVSRARLEALAAGRIAPPALFPGAAFPLIARPLDSHGGRGLERLDAPAALAAYLLANRGEAYFVSPFVDYRSADGQFRKFRVAMIGGRPYASHMAIASHWMIHYVNAAMDESADKRAEEARFMETFDADFARRHAAALEAIDAAIGLDYYAVDCAETADGRLLVFEADNAMIVHAGDDPVLYPYKLPQMRRLFAAFRALLADAAAAPRPLSDRRA